MEDPTGTTHTSNSSLSSLSLLDNSTDEFGQQILNYARHGRDQRRLQDAISTAAPAFSKARSKPGVALTLENLERNANVNANAAATSAAAVQSAPGSIATPPQSLSSDDRSTPSPNIPRQWGRKGRKKNDFLRRITSSGRVEETATAAAADEKNPDVLFPRRTQFTGDIDVAADDTTDLPMASIEEVPAETAWKGETRSRLMRSTRVGKLLDRERDERLDFLNVPASTLGTRKSAENLRQQHEIESIKDLAVTKSRLDEIRENRAQRRRLMPDRAAITSTSRDETPENLFDIMDDIRDAPVLVEMEDAAGSDDHLSKRSISPRLNPRRPDSREVLRQLARASSSTPSSHNGSRPSSRTASRRTSQPSSNGNDRTPIPKTPLVMGAWVDTPMANTAIPVQSQLGSSTATNQSSSTARASPSGAATEEALVPASKEPQRPKSALEALIAEHREAPEADAFGDTTINSLVDIIGRDASLGDLDDETLDLVSNVGVRVSEPNRERRKELKALHRMNEKLRVARAHIRDTSLGLERVENQVEAAERRHEGRCSQCGCSGNGNVPSLGSLLSTAIKSTFYTRSKTGHIKTTFFGLASLLFLVWFVTEMTLCELYCQPRYAYTMKGYGVNIHAPRMPYVTTTIVFRPVGFLWRPILTLLRGVLRVIYQAFVDQGSGVAGSTSSMYAAAASSNEFAQATGWSMNDDTYL